MGHSDIHSSFRPDYPEPICIIIHGDQFEKSFALPPWTSGGRLGRTSGSIEKQPVSQEDLAARMGVDQGYVSKLEAGARNPTIVTMWHVAQALDVKPSDLFQESDSRARSSRTKVQKGK